MAFVLRDATPDELDRLAASLPKWQHQPGDPCIVAEATGPKRVVGGIVLGIRTTAPQSPVGLLDFTLLPRFRETNLLEQLVRAALERAQSRNVATFDLLKPVQPDAPELAVLQRLGFAQHRQLIRYEFDVPAILARTRAIQERLKQRGAIPACTEVMPFAQRFWHDAARLVLSEVLIEPGALKQIDEIGPTTFFNRASRVLLVDGQVKGVILGRSKGRESEVMALAVMPELRGGNSFANALLNFHYASITARMGQEVITMWADPARHPMTTHLARRMATPVIATEFFLQRRNVTI
jgi:ribosomal protein S18 acetylase RimI-like enzyme